MTVGRAWIVVLSLVQVACTTIIPGMMPHDIHRDAVRLEHERCDPTPVDQRLYGAEIVQRVTPYYRHVMGGPSGLEARLAGAELEVRPLAGITQELLQRGLECREAQLILGRALPAANEPYLLPEGWVKVDVTSGGGSFRVSLSAEDPARAHEVLARAQTFLVPR